MLSSTETLLCIRLTIFVVLEALRDGFAIVGLFAHLLLKEITDGHARPVEVLSEGKGVHLAVGAWRTNNEDPLGCQTVRLLSAYGRVFGAS